MGRNENMNNAATSARAASEDKNLDVANIGGDIPGLLPPIAPVSKKPRNPFEIKTSPITGTDISPVKRLGEKRQEVVDTKLGVKDESGKLTPTFKGSRRRKQDVMANRRKKAKDIPAPSQKEIEAYKKRNTPKEPEERPEKDPFEMATPYGEPSAKPEPIERVEPDRRVTVSAPGQKTRKAMPVERGGSDSTLDRRGRPLAAGGKRKKRR